MAEPRTYGSRTSAAAVAAVCVLTFCVIPLATALRWLLVLFVGLLMLIWVLRAGVDADRRG